MSTEDIVTSLRAAADAKNTMVRALYLNKIATEENIRALLDERAADKARIAELEADGPRVERGVHTDGAPWYGTLRELCDDYKQAARVEAQAGDEARARIAELEEDSVRYRFWRDQTARGINPAYLCMRDVRCTLKEVDAAIDLARKEKGAQG